MKHAMKHNSRRRRTRLQLSAKLGREAKWYMTGDSDSDTLCAAPYWAYTAARDAANWARMGAGVARS